MPMCSCSFAPGASPRRPVSRAGALPSNSASVALRPIRLRSINAARSGSASVSFRAAPSRTATVSACALVSGQGAKAMSPNFATWEVELDAADGKTISAHAEDEAGNVEKLAHEVAYVLCGGDGPPRVVTEQDILDLERDAFVRLLGTKETQDRISHMLKTGKPLRN